MKHFLITAAALVAFCTTAAAQKIEVEADYLYSLKDSLKPRRHNSASSLPSATASPTAPSSTKRASTN